MQLSYSRTVGLFRGCHGNAAMIQRLLISSDDKGDEGGDEAQEKVTVQIIDKVVENRGGNSSQVGKWS